MGFCYIAGLGRCGTMWLANALNDRDHGVAFHHELANPSTPSLTTIDMWFQTRQRIATERGVDVPEFREYFQFIYDEMGRYRVVGDTLSWLPHLLPIVHKLASLDKVIVLVRNGIQQLHSLWNHTEWRDYGPPFDLNSSDLIWNYTHLMSRYYVMQEHEVEVEWFKTSCWERLCHFWSSYMVLPLWLRENMCGTHVCTYRLESLVQDTMSVRKALHMFDSGMHMSDDRIRELQATDLNRRVLGDRSPEALWSKWTPEQRATFTEICGSCMEFYDYGIPS